MGRIARIILIALAVITIIGFFLLRSQTYSLIDIDADNYRNKIKANHQSISPSGIDHCIPDNIGILSSHKYISQQDNGSGFEILRETVDGFLKITLNSNTGMQYIVFFDKGSEPVQANIALSVSEYEPRLKTICDQLMIKQGFVLKKSNALYGNDILIKETDTNFILVEINNKYEYPNPPMSLMINTYTKNKFF